MHRLATGGRVIFKMPTSIGTIILNHSTAHELYDRIQARISLSTCPWWWALNGSTARGCHRQHWEEQHVAGAVVARHLGINPIVTLEKQLLNIIGKMV